MTDQLETDLRTMLAERAATITSDATAGEQVIAERLRTGDMVLADVVQLSSQRRGTPWRAVAAVLVVLAGVGAVVRLSADDGGREIVTQVPASAGQLFVGSGDPEAVARLYLEDRLQMSFSNFPLGAMPTDDPHLRGFTWDNQPGALFIYPVGGVVVVREHDDGTWEVVEAYSNGSSIDQVERTGDAITVRTTGPAESSVELSVHRLDGTSITAGGCGGAVSGEAVDGGPVHCDLEDEPIGFAAEPLTVRLSIVTDWGERVTLEEQLVQPSNADAQPSGGATTPTTAAGDEG